MRGVLSPGCANLNAEDIAMTTRREFLQIGAGGLAGLAFVGCHLMAARPARAQARRREVVVNGKRVKTVDVHAHCAVPEALALMNLKLGAPARPCRTLDMATQRRIASGRWTSRASTWRRSASTRTGTGPTATSPQQLITIQNEKLAEACAAHPDRFVAFASVALQHPDLAAEQLEEGVKKLRPARRRHRRQRRRRGAQRSEVPSVLGQGRGARRARLHPPAGRRARARPASGFKGNG